MKNGWLNDLRKEIEAERPGMVWGGPQINPQEVLDFLDKVEKGEA